MFPWSPEFRWDIGHVVFFGAFYSVLAVVAATLARALWAAHASRDDAHGIRWHVEFEELSAAARACRHQFTGAAPGRVCPNGFDCRRCETHPLLAAQRAARPEAHAAMPPVIGLDLPEHRLFHRGHTWVQPEADGTVTIGLDDFARRVVGVVESVELPLPGARVAVNGPLAQLRLRGSTVRVLAPIDGTVVEARAEGGRFVLRVRPDGPLDGRHLLTAAEARAWFLREIERLQLALGDAGLGPALADGGDLATVSEALTRQQQEALLGTVFLEP